VSWRDVLVLAVFTTVAATVWRGWWGFAAVGAWWVVLLGFRLWDERK
jgi:hypothetical protein